MSEPDPKTMLREFKEYVDLSCESTPHDRRPHWRITVDHLGLACRQMPTQSPVIGQASEISGC